MSAKNRNRAAVKSREKIKRCGAFRLLVRKTNANIYAHLISPAGKMLMTVSTLSDKAYGGNIEAAKKTGEKFAQSCLKKGIKSIAFDCGGNRYHGRVSALADAARSSGLVF